MYVWDAVRERMASQHPGLLKQLAGGAYMREAKTMLATLGRESAAQLLNGLAPRAGEAVDAVALRKAEESAVDDVEGRDEEEEQRAAAAAQRGGMGPGEEDLGAGGEGADNDDGTSSLADSIAAHATEEAPEAMLAQARKQMTLVYEDVCENQPELFSDAVGGGGAAGLVRPYRPLPSPPPRPSRLAVLQCDTMYQELDQYISLFPLIAQRCSYSLCQYKGMCGASARDPDFDASEDQESQMMSKSDATVFGDNCKE